MILLQGHTANKWESRNITHKNPYYSVILTLRKLCFVWSVLLGAYRI